MHIWIVILARVYGENCTKRQQHAVHFALDQATGNSFPCTWFLSAWKKFQHLYFYFHSFNRVIPWSRQRVQTWTATCVSWGGPTGRSLRSYGTSGPLPYMTRTAARISGVGESVQTFPSTTSWPRISARNEKCSGHFLLSTNDTWNIDHCFIKCMEYIQCYSFLVLKNIRNPKGYGKNFKFYGLHVIKEVSMYF